MQPLVHINTATEDEIRTLHGIGPRLAAEIVRHRQAHGPFTGPGDLARVRGIGGQHATALAPDLDFSLLPPGLKPRNWKGFLAALALMPFVVLVVTAPASAGLAQEVRLGALTGDPSWDRLWSYATTLLTSLCALAWAASVAARDVTRDRVRGSRFARYANVSVLLMLLGVLTLSVSTALLSPRLAAGGAASFWRAYPWILAATTVFLLLLLGPPLLAGIRPAWARNAAARRAYAAGWVLGTPVLLAHGLFTWHYPRHLTPWTAAAYLVCGAIVLSQGVMVLRRGRSPFDPGDYDFAVPPRERVTPADALARFDQLQWSEPWEKKLAEALAARHRASSRWKMVGAMTIVSALWVIGTTIGAIFEWEVQRRWESKLRCLVGLACERDAPPTPGGAPAAPSPPSPAPGRP